MRERSYNIKRDLKKLATRQMALALDTGGGAVSAKATEKCRVSFKLTKSVMLFAGTVQLKTTGLPSCDSDSAIVTAMSLLKKMGEAVGNDDEERETEANEEGFGEFLCENYSAPASPLLGFPPTLNIVADVPSTTSDTVVVVPSSTPICDIAASTPIASNDTTVVRKKTDTSQKELFPNSQFFMTTQQRSRAAKRRNDTSSNTSCDGSSSRGDYYAKKTELVADEVRRRTEWHNVCVALKKQELELKTRQSEFWLKATAKLDSNVVRYLFFVYLSFIHFVFPFVWFQSLGDIARLANLAAASRANSPIEYDATSNSMPVAEVVDTDGAHLQYVYESETQSLAASFDNETVSSATSALEECPFVFNA